MRTNKLNCLILIGLIDIKTKKWISRAPLYWSHKEAIKNGMKTPSDIDNYAFNINLTEDEDTQRKMAQINTDCCILINWKLLIG